jgi:hypothetical protein
MCAALGLAGIAVYLQFRERNLAQALLGSNALVAASMLTHPNALLYFACLAGAVIW